MTKVCHALQSLANPVPIFSRPIIIISESRSGDKTSAESETSPQALAQEASWSTWPTSEVTRDLSSHYNSWNLARGGISSETERQEEENTTPETFASHEEEGRGEAAAAASTTITDSVLISFGATTLAVMAVVVAVASTVFIVAFTRTSRKKKKKSRHLLSSHSSGLYDSLLQGDA